MATVKSLNKWANSHTYIPLDLVRIALGVFLFIKGASFVSNTEYLTEIVKPLQGIAGSMAVIHYVAPAHFVGGVLIVFGLLTRWAVAAQLPILLGAIVINFMGEMNANNLIQSLIVFLLCAFFLVYGSGKNSADYYFKMQK